jgi:predicted RNase H-like HicB family nuclease
LNHRDSKTRDRNEGYLNEPYPLVITPDEDGDGGYGVDVIDLPGCVTFAENRDDIPGQVREAITSWVGSALKHGDPVLEPSTVAN